ncbi:CAMKK/ELM protein kinase [Cryptococcus wingfieldii CBS 7118]|uniref:non-specific serine/threonine protein kinase n=1 Tax=Cryptococcus wingfieldii CBS 7118 TaxID=1295528 RepID=A0A1E3JRL9_9TREE|nr:CAMKK/ELM protein kinase [Cryptococcus wingfieldii CBS 7118]ODO03316.1 CAMKK/ELM protein kinase [Cryptococcus wingfieldii CBS 7118]
MPGASLCSPIPSAANAMLSRRSSNRAPPETPPATLSRNSSLRAHSHDSPVAENAAANVIETGAVRVKRDQESGKWMINQYRVLSEIGSGTHGRVRLGQDMSAEIPTADDDGELEAGASPEDSFWAIKIVDRNPKRKRLAGLGKHKGSSGGAKMMNESEIRKEIAIFKKVNHPNVVRMKEIIDDPESSKIYMVLEWCRSGEIIWKDGEGQPALTVGETRKIFRDTLLGLEYLHHQGIIHRDIKPSNLLRAADGTVKISDFGCSHFSEALQAAVAQPGHEGDAYVDDIELAKTAGSPAFFAPEMCYSGLEAELSPKSTTSHGTPSSELPSFTLRPPSCADSYPEATLSVKSATSRTFPLKPTDSNDSQGSRRPSSYRSQSSSATAQRRGQRLPITNAIDAWALGVTLYCLLFGKTPFDAPNEYLLMQVIASDPYIVPPFMGKDRLPTGNGGLPPADEAVEALNVLAKLLEKDASHRISLEQAKKHPFTLRGLHDPAAWLAQTDPHTQTFVTVSSDEVAAAVTKSTRFRDRFKRGIKSLSVKLFSATGRARGHSVSSTDTPLGLESPSGTPSSGQAMSMSAWTSQQTTPRGTKLAALNAVATPSQDASPINSPLPQPSLVRRISQLNGTSSEHSHPLPVHSASGQDGSSDRPIHASPESMRDPAVKLPPSYIAARRLSSHLAHHAKPVIVPLMDDTTHPPHSVASSSSLDRFRSTSDQPYVASLRHRESSEADMYGRQRSHSNASSISSKLARLWRTTSQRSKSLAPEREPHHDSDIDDLAVTDRSVRSESPGNQFGRMSLEDSFPRESLEYLDSSSPSSPMPSPERSLPAGWDTRMRTNISRRGSSLSEEFTGKDVPEEEIDWEGSISDEDDYVQGGSAGKVGAPSRWNKPDDNGIGLGIQQSAAMSVSTAPSLEPIPDGSPIAPMTFPVVRSPSRPTPVNIRPTTPDSVHRVPPRTSPRISHSPLRTGFGSERTKSPLGGKFREDSRRTVLADQANSSSVLLDDDEEEEEEGLAISISNRRRRGSAMTQLSVVTGDR